MHHIKYLRDNYRPNDKYEKVDGIYAPRINSKIDVFNADTGQRIWEPLHNKTVIAGAALTGMKLFDLDRFSIAFLFRISYAFFFSFLLGICKRYIT